MEIFTILTKNSNLDEKCWENTNYLKNTSILDILGQLSCKWIDFEKRLSYDCFLIKTNWFLMFMAKSMLWNDYKMTNIFTGKHVTKNN